MLTNPAGTVAEDMLFYPWGDAWQSAGGGGYNFAKLPIRDLTTNTDLTMARFSSPNFGRWFSPDPIGTKAVKLDDPQTWNMYAYVRNNPTNLTDPTGLFNCDVSGGDCEVIEGALVDMKNAANSVELKSKPAVQEQNQDRDQQDQQQDQNQQQQPLQMSGSGGKGGGQQPKGERRLTGKPEFKDKPGKLPKGVRPNPDKPGQYQVWDSHKGTWIDKSKGWSPDTVKKVAVGVFVVGTAAIIIKIAVEACLLGACYP